MNIVSLSPTVLEGSRCQGNVGFWQPGALTALPLLNTTVFTRIGQMS